MNDSFKRATPYQKTLADLHDTLGLHVSCALTSVFSICAKCGAPIESVNNIAYKQISEGDIEALKSLVLSTNRYNKYILKLLANSADGALFIARRMGKVKPEYKAMACKDPSTALEWALAIDGNPTKQTWLGVRFSKPERDEYKKKFNLTDADIRKNKWHDDTTPQSEFSPSPSDCGQFKS